MSDLSPESLGPLQRAVMEVLWEGREVTVHDVLARLPSGKTLAYTSVLSCLQKLEKLGWIEHRAQDRAYFYRPVKSRTEVGRSSLRRLLTGLFGGDRTRLFQQLLDDDELTAEELAELRRQIDERGQQGGG